MATNIGDLIQNLKKDLQSLPSSSNSPVLMEMATVQSDCDGSLRTSIEKKTTKTKTAVVLSLYDNMLLLFVRHGMLSTEYFLFF